MAWDLLLEFKERYPNSQIRQTELSPEHMEEELQKGNVDYVISGRLTMAPGLVCEVFREDPLALAVPADHPLASRKWIRLKEAEGEHFACLPKGYEYRTIVEEMCQDAGFTPNVVVECFHCHMAGVVGSGKAVTLMAENRVLENSYEERSGLSPSKTPCTPEINTSSGGQDIISIRSPVSSGAICAHITRIPVAPNAMAVDNTGKSGWFF